MDAGILAGIIIGSVVGGILIGAGCVCCYVSRLASQSLGRAFGWG